MTSITHVQKVGGTSGNGVTTVKVIPTTATTPGNTIIAVAVWYPSSGAYPTGAITDSSGNTYTTLYSFAGSSGTGPSFLIAAAFRAASVGLTPAGITATFSTGPFSVLLVDEWSAVGQTQDGSTVTGSGSGTSVAFGPATISNAASLILAYVASFGNLSTTGWSSGWTSEFQSAAPTASLGYQLPGTTGSYSGTATLSSTEIWQSAMYALEPSGPYVSPVGTPALAAATASNGMSIAGSWGTGQSRTAGDLLVAAVTAYGTTTAVLGTAPSGWTLACAQISGGNTISAHYTKVAAGSDSAPTFTATCTGTSGDASLQVVLHEWSDSAGGTPVLYSTGLASGTSGTITPASGAVLPSAGCGAIASAICSQGTTAATTTWTTPAGWNLGADQLTSLRSQMASYYATPATSGSALSCLFTHSRTSTFQAATLVVIAPSGTTPSSPMVVQAGGITGATVSSLTASFGAPTISGDCLFMACTTPVNDATVATVKLGTSADNWASQVTQSNATYTVGSIWADPANAGGQTAVAVTLSTSDSPSVSIYEVSGLAASSPLDQSSVAGVNAAGAAWSSGASGTTTQASEFVLGVVGGYNNAGPTPTITGPAGWSNQATLDAATGLFQMSGCQIASSTGTFTYSGTSSLSSPNNYYAALVGTFKAATAPPAAVVLPPLQQPAGTRKVPPGRTGRAASGAGVFSGTGPALKPANSPVRAAQLPQRGGTAQGRTGWRSFSLFNTFESQPSGTGVNTANSGGVDGSTAFDVTAVVAGGTKNFDNAEIAHGTESNKMATSSTAGEVYVGWSSSLGVQQPVVWVRLYLYFTAYPVAAQRIVEALQGTTAVGGITIDTSGLLHSVDASGANRTASTNHIPLNKWFRVEGFITGSPNAGQVEFKLFEPLDSQVPLETQTSAATLNTLGPISLVRFGHGAGSAIANLGPWWQDDIGVSNTGYMGPTVMSGPPLYPLQQPASARKVLPARGGRIASGAGVFSGIGPAFVQLRAAISGRRLPFSKGRASGGRGTYAGQGPAYTELRQPVSAPKVVLPHLGRAQGGAGKFSGAGPAPAELRQPVTIPRPQRPRGGRAVTCYAPPPFVAPPTTGPRLYPLQQPAGTARRAPGPFLHGRAEGRAGTFSSLGPAFTQLRQAVSGRRLAPFSKGWARSSQGTRSGTGPALAPLRRAVTPVRLAAFSRGRAQGHTGTVSGLGPALAPLRSPVAARALGRRAGQSRSLFVTAAAAVVLSPMPAVPGLSMPGAASPARPWTTVLPQPVPEIAPALHKPVSAPRVVLPHLGRIITCYAPPPVPTPPPTSGPQLYPLTQPIGLARRARGPFRKGRFHGNPGGPYIAPQPAQVVNTWTASRQINPPGFFYGAPMSGSLDCPVASGAGNWLIAICSWTLPPGFLGATMEVADDAHGYWIPLGAPNGDTAATGYTRSSIWARPGGSAANPVPGAKHVYLAPAGMPGPVYPAVVGVTVIEVTGMSPYAGIPAVVPASSNAASSIAANAPAPTSPALMVTVAASDAAAFTSGPGAGWTSLAGVSVSSTAPVILHTSPAWQVASSAQAASWATGTAGDLSACTAVILMSNPAPSQPNPGWPATQLRCAFGSGALTPRSQMTWTDISSRFLAGQETSAQRGKNRQLDQTQAAQISLTLENSDSALDPGNVNSPYWPNVVADTPIQLLMTWQGRTYSQFMGYVSKWPQQWKEGTRQGLAAVTVTDAWSLLIDQLAACQQAEMLLTGPYAYWTCGDAAGSAYAANYAPGNQNVLTVVQSKSGALGAVADFGADSGANSGDPSGTLWSQSGLASGDNGYGFALVCADENYPSLATGTTVMGWFNPTGGATQVNADLCLMRASNAATGAMWQVDLVNPSSGTDPGGIKVTVWDKVTRAATATIVNTADFLVAPLGGILHIAMLVTQTSWQVIVNGGGFTGGSGSCNLPPSMSWLSFMGTADRFSTSGMFNGECCHLGVFPMILPSDRVAQIVIAGYPQINNGEFAAEHPSSRIERLAGYGGWAGPRAFSTTSATQMAAITDIQGSAGNVAASGVITAGQGQQAGEAITNIVASDNGFLSADGGGVLCYLSRGDFYGKPPAWYIGELAGTPLNENWSLVAGYAPWAPQNGGSLAPSLAWTYLGYPSMLLTGNGSTAGPYAVSEVTIPVTGLATYQASVAVYSPQGWGAVQLNIEWFDSTGTYISGVYPATVSVPSLTEVTLVTPGTAPSNAVFAHFYVQMIGTPAGTVQLYCALPTLQPAASAGTAGEYPAEPDITFSEDKALLYNTAQLTQSTGTGVAVTAQNTPSALQHGQSPFTATVYQFDPNVVADEANWVVETQGTPVNRFESVTVNAARNPVNWPFVLGVEPGTPLQVARRPVTAQTPTVVQGIAAQVTRKFDFLAGTAEVTCTGDTFPEGQVLIADDPKYGQLGQGYVLGW